MGLQNIVWLMFYLKNKKNKKKISIQSNSTLMRVCYFQLVQWLGFEQCFQPMHPSGLEQWFQPMHPSGLEQWFQPMHPLG